MKVKQFILGFLVFTVYGAGSVYAQQVQGLITDESIGDPLPGVNIIIKGTTIGTSSDTDGNYQLTVPSLSDTLVFSFIGFQTQEIPINGRTEIDVALIPQAIAGEELVVVGYGSQKKSDLTGSVASVSSEDLEKTPVATFDLALQGRAPGLHITSTSAEPGGGTSIRIRGSNSISGNNEPLIVLDGYPLPEGGEASNDRGRGQGSNLLSFLNPADIESVEVLKDASATAIYGARGANGVIIVTTKKGSAGDSQINFTSEVGFSTVPDFPPLLTGPEFAALRNEVAIAGGNDPIYDGVDLPKPDEVPTTKWVDLILRNGATQRYQLDFSGGTDKTRYFVSGNFRQEKGVVKFTNFNRGNLRLNFDTEVSERLSLSANLNYTRSVNNRSQEGTGFIIDPGAVFNAFKANPAAIEGQFTQDESITAHFRNPLIELTDKKDQTNNENIFMNVQAEFDLATGLEIVLRGGNNNKQSRREIFWPTTTGQGELNNGLAVYNTFGFNDYVLENYLNYIKEFEGHNINLTAGYSWQQTILRRVNNRVTDFPTDNLGTNGLQLGLQASNPGTNKIKRVLSSYYLRTNYNFKSKYYLTFSGRIDGSSVFAVNNKWGFFPSGAVAWTISQEDFLEESPIISNLKIRASYGITGSQAISPYGSLSRLGVDNYVIGDTQVSGIAPATLGNPDLKWENTEQIDVGLDLGLFDDRIYATVDYYKKTTRDLLQNFQLSPSIGFTSTVNNIGSLENKGLEIQVGGYILDGSTFQWNSNLNYSMNRSKILDLGGSEIFGPAPAANITNQSANIMREGEPFGAFYGYRITGLIQPSDFDDEGNPTFALFNGDKNLGNWKFFDRNEDGVITPADRVIIGNPNPDFIFGWSNDFSYKNLTLSVFVQGVVGNDIMNINNLYISSGRIANNQLRRWFENRWTENNQHNDIRYPAGNVQQNLQPNNAIVEDGSFVRLKNISLRYQVPIKSITFLRKAEIYATATNLLTITNYSGFDPEVGIFGDANLAPGIDFASYPRAKVFTFGVNIGF